MYYTTKEFAFKTNEELDAELTKLYQQAHMEVVSFLEYFLNDDKGGRAVIKFKVK